MKTLSLKLDVDIFEQTEKMVAELKKPRNRYINEALAYYNKIQRRKWLAKRLKIESEGVREESMKVLREFEAIDYGEDSTI